MPTSRSTNRLSWNMPGCTDPVIVLLVSRTQTSIPRLGIAMLNVANNPLNAVDPKGLYRCQSDADGFCRGLSMSRQFRLGLSPR
jgi:hypothetical protein